MQKNKYLLLLVLFLSLSVYSQNDNLASKILKGQVIDSETKKSLSASHIINLNSVTGTITNDKGFFEITAKANDTVMVSYLGHSSIKIKVTNDLLKGNELLIALYEKSEEVKEIIIRSSKLIGVLEVDVKQVPKDKFTRIKINGLRQTYEISRPRTGDFSSPLAALFQPVDFLYKLFGKKPKQLKKLQKIKKEDNLRKIMAGKFDREVMMEYLEMDRNDLMKLISDCNYSDYFVKNASDLQLIEAVLDCYEIYKALKNGKIERSRLPYKKRN
ncbi:MAG: carboxypeptidase-like regulatory domain-containing protein [Flavobacterium sp.]|nr:carboxypeptidase-like regulatory domain-containing protein [Flavobacterium sp.]